MSVSLSIKFILAQEEKRIESTGCVTNKIAMRPILRTNVLRILGRYYSEGFGSNQSSSAASTSSQPNVPNVPGLSSACVHPASGPVGPGIDPNKNGAYKVPEYFCYDNMSFFEAEIEMAKYRLPQPSALKQPSS